jgi:hypothetical protein
MTQQLPLLFIASPVQRSGTTLLQRLLCSSPDAIIFGESLANDLNTLFAMLHNKALMLAGKPEGQLQRVLDGDVNDWIPDLLPEASWVTEAFEQAIFQYLDRYQQLATQHGRKYWGCKQPAWPVPMLRHLLQTMPNSKVLYITRDLADCVRSAKLIGYCEESIGIRQFAQAWLQHQQMVNSQLDKSRLLSIRYETLCATPGPVLEKIEAFTGVQQINPDVLQHRINNYDRSHETPPGLTEEEEQIIKPYIQHLEQIGMPHATI